MKGYYNHDKSTFHLLGQHLPQHHGPKHLHPSGPQAASRHRFRDRFSCDQP